MTHVEFNLVGIPASMNEIQRKYRHHMKRHAYYQGWYRKVSQATIGIRPQYPFKHARISITAFYPPKRFRDFDGLVASLKPIVDGLTKCAIIQDDNYKVTGPWIVNQIADKGAKLGVIKVRVDDMTETIMGNLNPEGMR